MFNIKFLLSNLFNKSRTNLIVKEFSLNQNYFYSWGMKKSGKYIRNNRKKFKVVLIEDGFIHSFGYKKQKIPLSICYDNKGIYYNFESKSDLFEIIKNDISEENYLRAKNIIKLWKKCSISKYNFPYFSKPPSIPYILLIDQVFGDLSIKYGGANEDSFRKMFDFSVKNWPNHKIIIKVHPDVINYKKRGFLDKAYYSRKNVEVLGDIGQINKLVEFSTAVCVVTSQVGFEALIYGKEVHVFGNPFYSGLGLTIDHKASKDTNKSIKISLEQLVFALLVKYQIFLDPRNKKICEVEEIMQYIKRKRDAFAFFPKNTEGLNFTPWKARQINRFFYNATGKKVKSFKRYNGNMQNIMVWGKKTKSDNYISKVNNFISVEDGFIRSVGLGADLYPPLSLLFDKKGIHYDASKESDLEYLLQNTCVNDNEIIRARKIINLIIKLNISKYNLRLNKEIDLPKNIEKKKIIGVLGQVETDNSIIYGVPENTIQKTNFALVEQVRKDYPDAYIIYKPHPDTESGLRAKGSKEESIFFNADLIAADISLIELFRKVDKIAVFTSLGGFEALIRGIPVTTYGLPFYAGWGLTEDKLYDNIWAKRRTKILTIEELTFIALVKYPFYSSVKFNCLTELENIIDEISSLNMKKNLEQMIFKNWGMLKDSFLRNPKFPKK